MFFSSCGNTHEMALTDGEYHLPKDAETAINGESINFQPDSNPTELPVNQENFSDESADFQPDSDSTEMPDDREDLIVEEYYAPEVAEKDFNDDSIDFQPDSNSTELPNNQGSLKVEEWNTPFCIHDIGEELYFMLSVNLNFHYISGTLAEYIGMDKFNEWIEKTNKETDFDNKICGNPDQSVVGLIQYFNISRDEMEWIFAHSRLYYDKDCNLDIIYSGDEKLINEYYGNPHERISIFLNRNIIGSLKKLLSSK